MESRKCPACTADLLVNDSACPRCGAVTPVEAKKRQPVWVWVLIGVGGGCPTLIVLLGLLATLIVPSVMEQYRSTDERAKADITAIWNALNEYALRNQGRFPDSLEVLVIADENGFRYLQSEGVPTDPWGQEYYYDPPTADAVDPDPHLWSGGKDGITGTEDDIDSRTMNDY